MNKLTFDILGVLQVIREGTVHTITRRLGADGRDVRVALDELVTEGRAAYLDGQGNNRRYRLVERS